MVLNSGWVTWWEQHWAKRMAWATAGAYGKFMKTVRNILNWCGNLLYKEDNIYIYIYTHMQASRHTLHRKSEDRFQTAPGHTVAVAAVAHCGSGAPRPQARHTAPGP